MTERLAAEALHGQTWAFVLLYEPFALDQAGSGSATNSRYPSVTLADVLAPSASIDANVFATC